MKNILYTIAIFISVIATIITLSSFTYNDVVRPSHNRGVHLAEYKLNNHYYVVASIYGNGVSVIHSPNCKCFR